MLKVLQLSSHELNCECRCPNVDTRGRRATPLQLALMCIVLSRSQALPFLTSPSPATNAIGADLKFASVFPPKPSRLDP